MSARRRAATCVSHQRFLQQICRLHLPVRRVKSRGHALRRRSPAGLSAHKKIRLSLCRYGCWRASALIVGRCALGPPKAAALLCCFDQRRGPGAELIGQHGLVRRRLGWRCLGLAEAADFSMAARPQKRHSTRSRSSPRYGRSESRDGLIFQWNSKGRPPLNDRRSFRVSARQYN